MTLAFVQTDWGQNWLARKVTDRLSKDLQSRVHIDHVRIGFFNRMNLKGVLVEDQNKDTLLYAGTVQVNITDWFFLKEQADLKYIGLENAVIKLQRTDSVWNYQFLDKYMAGGGGGTQKKAGIEFNLKQVEMYNVSIVQKDAWVGQDFYIKLGALNLDANTISITRKLVDANQLTLDQPYFHQYLYKGRKPKSTAIAVTDEGKTVVRDTSLQWNPDNWNMLVKSISIKNGTYRNDRDSLTPSWSYFDGEHLNFGAITGTINDFRFVKDTLRATANLSTKERSGFTVERLQANLRFHPQLMEFNDLFIKTNRSVIGDYFAMKFSDIGDMNDFIHAVTMNANFKNASVASDDIAYFAPQVKDWNKIFQLDGKAKGTVDALSGEHVNIRAGFSTALQGDFSLVGLPNIYETLITVKADELRTNYADAVTFIPALRDIRAPDLSKLGAIRFQGTYTGFINDFVTYGTIQTALGTVVSDLNMKLPQGSTPPVYSGSLNTSGFQLGQFLHNTDLGIVAFKGDVKGKGFDWKTLDMTVNGTVNKIQVQDYTYQNITAKGRLFKQTFSGDFAINDPNAQAKGNGMIDFSTSVPSFNLKADVTKANLKALGLANEELELSGRFDVDMSGKDIGSLLGKANISEATLLHNGQRLSFDSLYISSTYADGNRTLRARSNELDAVIEGKFDLETLPDAFMLFLNRYYPAYIKKPKKVLPNQDFTFKIETGVIEDYIKLFDKRLSGFNNSKVEGSLNVASNLFKLDATVPVFSYDHYSFSDVVLNGDGDLDRLSLNGSVTNAIINDSLIFPQTSFTINARNDISDIVINTTANQTINKADVSAQVRTFADGVLVSFNPSSFVINGKTWNIEQGGELDLRSNSVVQGTLVLHETNQEIRITTLPSDVGSWNDIHVTLQNINLGDITPFFVKSNRIEGLLSGDVTIEDPQDRFNIIADIKTDQLRVDNDSIGKVEADMFYNNKTGLLTGKGNNLDPDHQIQFDMALDFKDSAQQHRDRISVLPINYPVKILERFVGGLFSDLQGYVTGRLDIVGEGDNRKYVGKAQLKDAGLKVDFTQVFYKIDDTEIELKEDLIDLGVLRLRDRDGKTATVKGTLAHKNFQNMEFDIEAEVDGRPMELLNTTYKDNQQFYGRAKGTGFFKLWGPQDDMNMYIEARPSTTDSSYITIPPSKSRESGQADFMVERKYGKEMTEKELSGSSSNITYEVNLTANPWVNVEVILDELTGDIIKGRGTGELNIKAGTSEPLSIRGRYDIQDGNYLFTFQSFFKKPFVLRPGSNNYIEWTGDPYKAQIRFDAVYQADNVSFTPLANSLSLSDRYQNFRGDVNVITQLSGDLFRPSFSFKIEVPENSPAANEPSLLFGLQQIERNPNEINKQVTYLIVFNSFAPYENSAGGYKPLNEFAYSTLSGLLFGGVNRLLNQQLSKLLGNNDVSFNFTGSLYNPDLLNQDKGLNLQANAGVSIGVPLNDRIQVTFGGTFNIPISEYGQSNLNQQFRLFPDVNVNMLLNQSGSIRATFFYNQSPSLFPGSGPAGDPDRRAGAKVSYRKEFNSLSEFLFGKKKGTPKAKVKDSTSKASDSTTVINGQ
ncbi:translocation/assembly module TamB domain-containing protein [Flavisolibacter tropicus]|uniref:translocation/assembly module TamB domain-containing protein n=1 Tax=Flavisolibacter tropicus TaxID=1492898 RepID=UPI0011E0235A|nr:translocation/assembly module TamB domain-containing protein [Flavisolibacter tropicus]